MTKADLEVLTVNSNNTCLKLIFSNKSWFENNSLIHSVRKDGEVVDFQMNGFTELILPSEHGLYTVYFELTLFETGEVLIFGFEVLVE